MAYEVITLDGLFNGALREKVNYELKRIHENIISLNHESVKERTLTIKIKLKPNENKERITTV